MPSGRGGRLASMTGNKCTVTELPGGFGAAAGGIGFTRSREAAKESGRSEAGRSLKVTTKRRLRVPELSPFGGGGFGRAFRLKAGGCKLECGGAGGGEGWVRTKDTKGAKKARSALGRDGVCRACERVQRNSSAAAHPRSAWAKASRTCPDSRSIRTRAFASASDLARPEVSA